MQRYRARWKVKKGIYFPLPGFFRSLPLNSSNRGNIMTSNYGVIISNYGICRMIWIYNYSAMLILSKFSLLPHGKKHIRWPVYLWPLKSVRTTTCWHLLRISVAKVLCTGMSLSLFLLLGAQTTLTPARLARVLAGVQESANKEGHVKLRGGCSTAEYGVMEFIYGVRVHVMTSPSLFRQSCMQGEC